MIKTVVIDAGHGGYDPGCINGLVKEKDLTLIVALNLEKSLKESDIEVIMTRRDDTAPGGEADKNKELATRVKIANDNNVDLFVSIHINAGGGRGAELFVYRDGTPITGLAKDIITGIGSIMGFHGQPVKDGKNYYVIKNTRCPAMIIELGFIDSDDINALLENITHFGSIIAKPLIDWCKTN